MLYIEGNLQLGHFDKFNTTYNYSVHKMYLNTNYCINKVLQFISLGITYFSELYVPQCVGN